MKNPIEKAKEIAELRQKKKNDKTIKSQLEINKKRSLLKDMIFERAKITEFAKGITENIYQITDHLDCSIFLVYIPPAPYEKSLGTFELYSESQMAYGSTSYFILSEGMTEQEILECIGRTFIGK